MQVDMTELIMHPNYAAKMGPVDRKPCRDCGKGLFRGQRRLAATLRPWLVLTGTCKRDGLPYTILDVFCNACRKKIQKGEKGCGPLLESIPVVDVIPENEMDMEPDLGQEDANFSNEDEMEGQAHQMEQEIGSKDFNENSVCNHKYLC